MPTASTGNASTISPDLERQAVRGAPSGPSATVTVTPTSATCTTVPTPGRTFRAAAAATNAHADDQVGEPERQTGRERDPVDERRVAVRTEVGGEQQRDPDPQYDAAPEKEGQLTERGHSITLGPAERIETRRAGPGVGTQCGDGGTETGRRAPRSSRWPPRAAQPPRRRRPRRREPRRPRRSTPASDPTAPNALIGLIGLNGLNSRADVPWRGRRPLRRTRRCDPPAAATGGRADRPELHRAAHPDTGRRRPRLQPRVRISLDAPVRLGGRPVAVP